MAEEHFHRFRAPRVEERVSPGQPRTAYAENAPAGQTPPLANGDDEILDVRTFEIAPTQVTRIAPHQKMICRSDAVEETIELLTRVMDEIELPPSRPPLTSCDRRQWIGPEVPNAICHRLHGIAAQKADRKLAMRRRGEAIVEGHLSSAEGIVEVLCGSSQDAGGAATDLPHRTVSHDVADLIGNEIAAVVN